MDDAQEEDLDGDRVVDSLDGVGRVFGGEGDQVRIELVPFNIQADGEREREIVSSHLLVAEIMMWGQRRAAHSLRVARLASGS